MTPRPMSYDEMAARLKTAAQGEMFSINQLELLAARSGSADLHSLTVAEVRRQAEALGRAHEIAMALARHPALARFISALFFRRKASA